jgi:PqqD family protein of HPr-rel-A system
VNDHDRPARSPSVETAVFDTEAVLYDERTGTVHHLNAPACAVWMLLDGRPVGAVVATLSEETSLPSAEIRRDVLQAIADLGDAGLLGG